MRSLALRGVLCRFGRSKSKPVRCLPESARNSPSLPLEAARPRILSEFKLFRNRKNKNFQDLFQFTARPARCQRDRWIFFSIYFVKICVFSFLVELVWIFWICSQSPAKTCESPVSHALIDPPLVQRPSKLIRLQSSELFSVLFSFNYEDLCDQYD